MTLASTLEPIYQEYKITRDCFKVTIRAVQENHTNMLANTDIIDTTEQNIEDCQSKMDRLAIVALWAFFERKIIEFVQTKSNTSIVRQTGPQPFADLLSDSIEKHIERKGEILSLFKDSIIDKELLKEANKIKEFRNRIVHHNLSAESSELDRTTPDLAYRTLSTILKHLDAM